MIRAIGLAPDRAPVAGPEFRLSGIADRPGTGRLAQAATRVILALGAADGRPRIERSAAEVRCGRAVRRPGALCLRSRGRVGMTLERAAMGDALDRARPRSEPQPMHLADHGGLRDPQPPADLRRGPSLAPHAREVRHLLRRPAHHAHPRRRRRCEPGDSKKTAGRPSRAPRQSPPPGRGRRAAAAVRSSKPMTWTTAMAPALPAREPARRARPRAPPPRGGVPPDLKTMP